MASLVNLNAPLKPTMPLLLPLPLLFSLLLLLLLLYLPPETTSLDIATAAELWGTVLKNVTKIFD